MDCPIDIFHLISHLIPPLIQIPSRLLLFVLALPYSNVILRVCVCACVRVCVSYVVPRRGIYWGRLVSGYPVRVAPQSAAPVVVRPPNPTMAPLPRLAEARLTAPQGV